MFHSVLLPRKRGIDGSAATTNSGSTKPLTWLATATNGPAGICSRPTISRRRKKTRASRRAAPRRAGAARSGARGIFEVVELGALPGLGLGAAALLVDAEHAEQADHEKAGAGRDRQ